MANSPTSRSLKFLRGTGWTAAVVEHWNPYAHIRQDLFGCFDIVAFKAPLTGVLAIQATSGDNVGHRVEKLKQSPVPLAWMQSGNNVEVWGWRKVGKKGKRKLWKLRRVGAFLMHDGTLGWIEEIDEGEPDGIGLGAKDSNEPGSLPGPGPDTQGTDPL